MCLINADLQRTAAKWRAERETSGIQPAITLIEKFDNITQTLRALDEKYDHIIVTSQEEILGNSLQVEW